MIQPGEHIADQILSAAIDDQLTLEERREANAHLETCSACSARLEEFRSVADLLRALPEVEVPRDFSIGPRLVADPPNVVRLRRWYGVARTGAASLAAAFVFLSAGALYLDSQPASSTQAPKSQFAAAPAAPVAEDVARQQSSATAAPAAALAARPAVQAQAPVPAPTRPAAQPPAAPQAGAAAPASQAAPAPAAAAAAPASQAAQAPALADSARAQTAPAASGGEVADQVTAATSVRPLPTPVPTLAPLPTPLPQPVAPPLSTARVDTAAPLRTAAAIVGVLAACGLLITLVVRHRLRAASISALE